MNQGCILIKKRKEVITMTMGERIKQRRIELDMSQRDLAAKMGYASNTTIAKIEQGKVDVSQARAAQFASALGVSVAYLMGWEEIQKKNDQLVKLVTRMRSDSEFMNAVQMLDNLTPAQYSAMLSMLAAMK